MSIRPLLVTALVGCMLSAGCGSTSETGTAAMKAFDVKSLAGDWTLSHLNGQSVTAPEGGRGLPTLSFFEPGRVGGLAGVNRWNSAVDQDALAKGEFSLKGVMTTMMAGDPAAMKLEQDFVGALSKTRSFDQKQLMSGVLSLRDGSGAETLRFSPTAK